MKNQWSPARRDAILVIMLACMAAMAGLVASAACAARPRVERSDTGKQNDIPGALWVRDLDRGLIAGPLIDKSGNVVVWYMTNARVLAYNQNGRRLWDKLHSAAGQNAWCDVARNPLGELFMVRHIENEFIYSKLLPNGSLKNLLHIRGGQEGLAAGSYAVGVDGGWVDIGARRTGLNPLRGKEYLSRYSASGRQVWSQYLQSYSVTNALQVSHGASSYGYVSVDSRWNIWLLNVGVPSGGKRRAQSLPGVELAKYSRDGSVAWRKSAAPGPSTGSVLRIDIRGNAFVAGGLSQGGYYIAKYGPGGQRLWVRKCTSCEVEAVKCFYVDQKGNAVVASMGVDRQTPGRAALIDRYDNAGKLVRRRVLPMLSSIEGLAGDGASIYIVATFSGSGSLCLIRLAEGGSER